MVNFGVHHLPLPGAAPASKNDGLPPPWSLREGKRVDEEAEARVILREAVGREPEPENLARFIHECFAPYGGVELELPTREPMREPPDFS